MFNLKSKALVTIFGVVGLLSSAVQAQEYPNRPVKLIVPYPPGGFVDIAARIVADGMQRQLKQPFIVDNRPGGSGYIAARAVAESKPDGYTLLIATNSEFAVVPATRDVQQQVGRDINPIGKIGSSGMVIGVGKNVPVKSIGEFAARVKASALPIQFGSPGTGSINHIVGEWLGDVIGAKFQHIPYKGGAATINALVGGEIEFAVLSVGVTKPQADAGNVKILAISSPDRSESVPDVPTLKESSVPLSSTVWVGLFSPQKMPAPVNAKIVDALNKVLAASETKAKLLAQGLDLARASTPKAFLDEIITEAAQYKTIVKRANIVVQ